MRILLGVHKFFPDHRTGTEVLTLELARGLTSRGHDVAILTGEPHADLADATPPWLTLDEYDGLPVHRLHYGNRQDGDPIRSHFNAPERISLVLQVVSDFKPDIVHFHHLRAFSSQVVPKLDSAGYRVLFTPTDYWVICPKFLLFNEANNQVCSGPESTLGCLCCLRPMPQWLGRLAVLVSHLPLASISNRLAAVASLRRRLPAVVNDVNHATRILPATQFLESVLARHGVGKDKIDIIPYGVDIGHLPDKLAVPDRYSHETPLQVGFIGSLSQFKAPHVILEALACLGDERQAVHVNIYGKLAEQGSYARSLREKADASKQQVSFHGTFKHENIGAVLRSMHVLVVPSIWYESTPLVLCSALKAGVFVLVSRLGGMTEAIDEGLTGASFEAGDAKDLSRKLLLLLRGELDLSELPPEELKRSRGTADYVADIEEQYLQVIDSDVVR